MKDDYLWDPSSAPDPEVERLERLLGRLRTNAPAPDLTQVRSAALLGPRSATLKGSRYTSARFLVPTLAAAASIVAMIGLTWQATRGTRSWEVSRMTGQPRIGSAPLAGTGRLGVGQTLVTDAASRARLDVSTIGQATVDTDSRVRLVDTREGHHKLALERGTLHAFITAPPGQFVVDTPSATATDLGCVYTLHVDEDGTGMLSVTAGWVAFEFNGRESFVPAGASARTDPRIGPGTPRYDDAAPELQAALGDFDYGTNAAAKARDLQLVLSSATPRDADLLAPHRRVLRDRGVDALDARVPMPAHHARPSCVPIAPRSISGGTRWAWGCDGELGGGSASGPYPREELKWSISRFVAKYFIMQRCTAPPFASNSSCQR
jgi:hypothetical protein